MAIKHWTGASGATWNGISNWTPSGVPVNGDSVFIDAGGAPVATQTLNVAGSLTIAANANLTIGGSVVGSLTVGGPIINAGTISLAGSSSVNASLRFGSNLALSGGGQVTLDDSANNVLSNGSLTNQDNTISGAGTFIGMTLNNQGLIEATYNDNALTLNTGNQIINNGILEANGGTLVINSHDLVVGSGHMAIAGGGTLVLNPAQEQQAITFAGAGNLDLARAYLGQISGFGANDAIDFSFVFSSDPNNVQAVWAENSTNTGGTLSLVDPSLPPSIANVATLNLAGQYTSSQFAVSDDGHLSPKISFTGSAPTGGGGPHEQIAIAGNSTSYVIAADNSGGVTVTNTVNQTSSKFDQVEFLKFTDKTVFVENADNANIARLYSAAFDRAPDIAGLSFWEDIYARNVPASAKSAGYYTALAQTNDGSGVSIATNFMQSSEFTSRYGTLSDTAFVSLLYQNVLGRGPDQAGLNFWVGQLEGGGQTREVVLVGFAESPENISKTSGDWLVTI